MFFDYQFGIVEGLFSCDVEAVFVDTQPVNTFQETVSLTGSNSSKNQSIGGSVSSSIYSN